MPGWIDVAKYRDWIYHAIIVGEFTAEQKAEMAKAQVQRAKDSIGKGQTPQAALDELNALREQRMREAAERAQ